MVVGGISDGVINLLAPAQLDAEGKSATWIGVVLSATMAVFFLSSLLTARRAGSLIRFDVAAGCAFALAVVMLPVLLPGSVGQIVTMLLLRSAVLGVLYAIAFPLAVAGARHVAVGSGTVNGILGLVWGAANFLGSFSAGSVVDVVGEQTVYAVLTALSVAGGVRLLMLMSRRTTVPGGGRTEPYRP
jgi:hypothetical protein